MIRPLPQPHRSSADTLVSAWLRALEERHTRSLTRAELLKAIRALSARYVERRVELPRRSPLDTAGKRAGFAAFYAPMHFLTVDRVVRELGANRRPLERVYDLGCGTGVASAAWALSLARPAEISGVDRHPWTIDEAQWTWRTLGLDGRARQFDLVRQAEAIAREPKWRSAMPRSGVVCAWSANELDATDRGRLLAALALVARAGAAVLIVEPIASGAAPWWKDWAVTVRGVGGRADEWRFDTALPSRLAQLDAEAGFQREGLAAKSLFIDLTS